MTAFELRAVNARYDGVEVLDRISLKIEVGERVALVGRSGAGKSTLLNTLYQHRRRGVALVPQELGLVNTLSVFHNVYMGRLNRHAAWYNVLNLARPLRREVCEVERILAELGLADKLYTPVGELSGGQRQRTAIARALHQGGEALLGDEPVSALDEHQAQVMLGAINNAYETVVLAMHDVQLALRHTDRVIGVKGRRLALDEPAAALTPGDLDSFYLE